MTSYKKLEIRYDRKIARFIITHCNIEESERTEIKESERGLGAGRGIEIDGKHT